MADEDIFLRNLGGRVGVTDWPAPPDIDPYAAVAAAVRRRAPVREPDPLALIASSGGVPWERFLPSDERARAQSYNAFLGNDFDPRDTFLSALGAVGTPALGPAEATVATLGAGAMRRAKPGIGHNQPPIEAPFPQYAEQYPPVGPPVWKPKEEPSFPGEMYEAKQLTPEAQKFERARAKIMADMKKKGYEPYFDPAKRGLVDPSNYPGPNTDTSLIRPTRADTVKKYTEAIDAPETRARLDAAIARGEELGNADRWYFMNQLEKEYIKELGPKQGRSAFLDEFAVPMAATTSGQRPGPNLMTAHYLEYLRKNNLPFPTAAHQMPAPVGGRRAAVNIRDYQQMRERGGYAGLGEDQPKMHDFSRSMIGDLSAPVMDEQMAGGLLKGQPAELISSARNTAYGQLQDPVRAAAAERGVPPGAIQDIAWAGFKGEAGKPMIEIVNEAIERTHRLTGMPRSEIVRRGLVRKEIPLYTPGPILLPNLGGNVQER